MRLFARGGVLWSHASMALLIGAVLCTGQAKGQDKLPNGMSLILIPNGDPTVSVRLLVPAGARHDPSGLEGLAHYVEHLIATDPIAPGPGVRPSSLRAHGWSNAWTSSNRTVYAQNIPANALETTLTTLATRIANFEITPEHAARERSVVMQELRYRRTEAIRTRLIYELYTKLGEIEPVLGVASGSAATIERFDLPAARAFWRDHYRPSGMTLVISGAFERDSARAMAEEAFAAGDDSTAAATKSASRPGSGAPGQVRVSLSDTGSHFTGVHFAVFRFEGLDDAALAELYAAVNVLRIVLAGGRPGVESVAAAMHKSFKESRGIDVSLSWRDKQTLQLGLYVEAATSQALSMIIAHLRSRIASLEAGAVPDDLIEAVRDGNRSAWIDPEDAPSADAVVDWLALGQTLEARAAFRKGMRSMNATAVVAAAARLAKPDFTAYGEINPGE